MTTRRTKSNGRARAPQRASDRETEIAQLTAAQARDRAGREPRQRKHAPLDEARVAAVVPDAPLAGAALRQQVIEAERRRLARAGLKAPGYIPDDAARAYESDSTNTRLLRELYSAVDQLREYHAVDPASHRLVSQEVAAHLREIELALARANWRARFPGFGEVARLHETLRRATGGRLLDLLDDPRQRRKRAASRAILGAPPRQQPSTRTRYARLPNSAGWTDLLRAAASLVDGNWPPDVTDTEPTTPGAVLELERAAIKTARARERARLAKAGR